MKLLACQDYQIAYFCGLFIICCFFTTFFCTPIKALSASSQTEIIKHTISQDPSADGFWKRNVQWKSRWVKYWRPKAIYVPIWKKVWSPVIQNEWVPLPKAPPDWKEESVNDSKMGDTNNKSSSSDRNAAIDEAIIAFTSSGRGGARVAKSYSGWTKSGGSGNNSGNGRSNYDTLYNSHRVGGDWKKDFRRTIVQETV